ncbi:MAG: DNA methyltransferase [Chloroflexota bacterium]|nr:DNA methyltransferase [Chloroflexota bacterium]
MNKDLLTVSEASEWATQYVDKEISTSNISYLIQYGIVKKHSNDDTTQVLKQDLIKYYKSYNGQKENKWKEELGEDINWRLSFDNLAEKERTKHVHRLHPYKGKFIPQLVEYFLDDHTDEYKKEVFFQMGDIVFDPFCGSGTALVQANELGLHAIGVDISAFNSLISNVKTNKHNLFNLQQEIRNITIALKNFVAGSNHISFKNELYDEMKKFNDQFFPSPEFRYKVRNGKIDQMKYGKEKEKLFLDVFYRLVKKYDIDVEQEQSENFLDKWYLKPTRDEIDFVFDLVSQIENTDTKKVLAVILSRTIRSCRATTHSDLATLIDPVTTPYYCRKHGKICKPLFSILRWWKRYTKDTVKRLAKFHKIRTATFQHCFVGDSRTIEIFAALNQTNPAFADFAQNKKIKGIFSSPPYVGLINYHQQHAYAYDLFGFDRRDESEIGPLYKGRGKEARDEYVIGISDVLINSKRFLVDNYDVFLVANDKNHLYPIIADRADMTIVNRYRRPVLNRTEKNKTPYSETIFHIKDVLA